MGQRVAVTTSGIAYAVTGSGPPLVYVSGWLSHLELSWALPAERAFFDAQAPLANQDLAAAERNLRQVATRYDGTAGGAQAQLALAEMLYDQGKYQDGLNALKDADDAPSALKPAVIVMPEREMPGHSAMA